MSRRRRRAGTVSPLSSFLDIMTAFAGVLVLIIVTMLILSQTGDRKVRVHLSDRSGQNQVDMSRTLFLDMSLDGLFVVKSARGETLTLPWDEHAGDIARDAHRGRYTFLLVFLRPGTFERFRTEIHPQLSQLDIPFGYEPVPDAWLLELAPEIAEG